MQRFVTGFDAHRLIVSTSIFYIIALLLACVYLWVSENKMNHAKTQSWLSQNRTIHSIAFDYSISSIVPEYFADGRRIPAAIVKPYANARGYGSEVLLASPVTKALITQRIKDVLKISHFHSVNYEMVCTMVSCQVDFYAVEPINNDMAKHANIIFSKFSYEYQ